MTIKGSAISSVAKILLESLEFYSDPEQKGVAGHITAVAFVGKLLSIFGVTAGIKGPLQRLL
jgi:hypothetical protein